MKKVIKISFILVFFILLIFSSKEVFGAEDFEIKITQNIKELTASDVELSIDISSTRIFDSLSSQAVQIIIGEESETNKWTDLGSGKNGIALKKTYNYSVKNNGKITIRIISWSMENKADLRELATQTYEISNIDKTKPVIEKIDVTAATNNSISLNVVAKDSVSGVAKYTCTCDSISYDKTDVSPIFELTELEENKEYNFNITVEDKVGNKTSTIQKIKTKAKEVKITDTVTQNQAANNTNTLNNQANENSTIEDSLDKTIANKNLPDVGARDFILIISFVGLIAYIAIKTKDRN